jgi:hypothetical protein
MGAAHAGSFSAKVSTRQIKTRTNRNHKGTKGTKVFLSFILRVFVVAASLLPHTRNYGITKGASRPTQVVGRDKIAFSFDQNLTAIMTIRVVAFMVRDVAYKDIADALLHGDLSKTSQNRYRGWRQAVQFILGKEAQKMKRVIRPEGFKDPAAHFFIISSSSTYPGTARVVISKWMPLSCRVLRVLKTGVSLPPFSFR